MVLGLVARAQNVFGGATSPAEPPQFAAPVDLEDDLGKGFFGTPTTPARGSTTRRYARSVGDNDPEESADDFANDIGDRLILGGAWIWAGDRSAPRR